MMVTKRWIVEGRVQGVSFRAHTQVKAKELGLCGWVRNLPNGCVETLAQGEDSQLALFHEWIQVGPPQATVAKVSEVRGILTHELESETFEDFQILRGSYGHAK